ncbi:MAG: hypothetical protein KAF40_03340 [Flavihumibacter sp.]|nr:hypothetical protein [Flavihumibacter sp.]
MEDILLDEDFDLLIQNGDLVIGPSSEQHQQLLLLSNKGDWRQFPMVGVGIREYLKDEDENSMVGEIKEQFEMDGMQVKDIRIANGQIGIDAYYP